MTKDEAKLAKAKIEAFERALDELCATYGVYIDHEDGHGSGRILFVAEGQTGCGIPFAMRWDAGGREVWEAGHEE